MNAYYRLYIKSILKLAATLVIKSSYTADSINTLLKLKGYTVDTDNPDSWKYYLNLAGQYHTSDTLMQVTSLDTLETIDFTIENLNIHRATKKEYTYGNKFYQDLVTKYPAQVMLINGIINPINMDTAQAADDHTILSYDTSLVEAQEQVLMPRLQKFISLYFVRYDNQDYKLFEPYYYPGLLAILYSKIPTQVENIRLDMCKTDQAHSYHIRQYLLSHSRIGAEFEFMTLKQKLYFYRNILYLNRNIGRSETFDELTQKVMTDRGFNLSGYNITHDYETLTTDLLPTVKLDRYTINGIDAASGPNHKSVAELLDLELPLARDNPLVYTDTQTSATRDMQQSLWGSLPTKVLESNVVDRTDAEPFTLAEVLLNHWIYLSHYGYFNSVVTFVNPSNGDTYRLSAKNAFIFYLYAYNRSINIELKTVPKLQAKRVRRLPLPTKAELQSLVETKKVPDYYIDYILDTQVPLQRYVSIETFREACVQIHKVMLNHREMRHYNGDYVAEGQLHTIIDRCYMDITINLADEMNYEAWLDEQGIDISSMGRVEFETIATAILTSATGADLGVTTRVREIHAAMIRIMQGLSSYSVQYIAQINDSPIKIIDGKFPKLTIPKEKVHDTFDIETPWPEILELKGTDVETIKLPVPSAVTNVDVRSESIRAHIPAVVDIHYLGSHELKQAIENPLPLVSLIKPDPLDLASYSITGIAGYAPIGSQGLSDLFTANAAVSGYEYLTEARRKALLQV